MARTSRGRPAGAGDLTGLPSRESATTTSRSPESPSSCTSGRRVLESPPLLGPGEDLVGNDMELLQDAGRGGRDVPTARTPPRAGARGLPLFAASSPDVRKTVNDLERSLERREHENLNLKILVRELEAERAESENAVGHVGSAGRDLSASPPAWRADCGTVQQDGAVWITAGARAGLHPQPLVSPITFREHSISLDHSPSSDSADRLGAVIVPFSRVASREVRSEVRTGSYHEETRQLRSQLSTLSSKLSQAEASQQAATERLSEAEESVRDLKQQLVTSAHERAAARLALAQLREQHGQLHAEHSRHTALHMAVVSEHEARRARYDSQIQEMGRRISDLEVSARLDKDAKGESERLVAEKDQTIEVLTKQSSEYHATVIQQEASIAELKAHLSKDAALVAQLKARVEQQEGLLVEQAAQLCQNEAHIDQLEREQQQQQAWDSLGTPGKDGSAGLTHEHLAADGSGDRSGGSDTGKGNGSAAVAAAAAKRVALAESQVASLEQRVRELKADKDKLAELLQEEQRLTSSLVKEVSDSHRLVVALQNSRPSAPCIPANAAAAAGGAGREGGLDIDAGKDAGQARPRSRHASPEFTGSVRARTAVSAGRGAEKGEVEVCGGKAAWGGGGDERLLAGRQRAQVEENEKVQEKEEEQQERDRAQEQERVRWDEREQEREREREEEKRAVAQKQKEREQRLRDSKWEQDRQATEAWQESESARCNEREQAWAAGRDAAPEARSATYRTSPTGGREAKRSLNLETSGPYQEGKAGEKKETEEERSRRLARDTTPVLVASPPYTAAIEREAALRKRICDLERACASNSTLSAGTGTDAANTHTPPRQAAGTAARASSSARSLEVEALLQDVQALLNATPLVPRRRPGMAALS